mgnify:CR=1 FL=1
MKKLFTKLNIIKDLSKIILKYLTKSQNNLLNKNLQKLNIN